MKTTITNSLIHLSPLISLLVSCSNSYTITASSAITADQFVTFADASVGFTLPAFTHSQTGGCPITQWQISTQNTAVTAPSGITISTASGSGSSSVMIVKPDNKDLHQAYPFYLKVSADGGSFAWFGPFSLNVGCFSGSVTFGDSSSLITSKTITVGGDTTNAFTFENPTFTRSWCSPLTNTIVKTDGSDWTDPAKLTSSGSQPVTSYNLVSTAAAETFSFKIKTSFPGSMTHLSSTITISI